MVESLLPKQKVVGSSPAVRSIELKGKNMTTIYIGMIVGVTIAHSIAAGISKGPKFPGDVGYKAKGLNFFIYLLILGGGAGLGALCAWFI